MKTIPTTFLRHAALKGALVLVATTLLSLPAAHAQTLLSYWDFNNVSPTYNTSGAGYLGSFKTSAAAYGETYSQTSNSTPGKLFSNTANNTVYNGASVYIDFSNFGTITNATINGKQATSYTSQASPSTDPAGYGVFLDSTVNRAATDSTTGGSLLLLNTTGSAINKYITFSLSSAGYASLSLTYATRLTNTVTSSQVWTYSLDGTNFLALTTLSPQANGTFNTQTLNLSTLSGSALDNQATFYLRMTYTGANAQGSQAIDNIQLTGTAVPEPSPALLVLSGIGAAFLCIRRRARVA